MLKCQTNNAQITNVQFAHLFCFVFRFSVCVCHQSFWQEICLYMVFKRMFSCIFCCSSESKFNKMWSFKRRNKQFSIKCVFFLNIHRSSTVCVCVMCVKVHFFKSRLKISYTFTAQRYVLHFFSTHFQRIYNTLYKWFCVFVFFLQVC